MLFLSSLILGIVFISGTILCVQDWRTCSVGIVPLFVFIFSCFCYYLFSGKCSLLLFAIFFCIGLFAKIFFKKKVFGSSDYLASIALSPFLCNNDTPMLLILIGCIGIIASILRKRKIIPFVSVILCSVIILRLIKDL